MMIRKPFAAILLLATTLVAPAAGAEPPALRGDVVVSRDTLTLGDLVANAPPALAATPVFRAPSLGQTGTIQVRRIQSAAESLGLPVLETAGRLQVSVSRAARHVGATEIEAVIRKALAKDFGLDPAATGLRFDGAGPTLLVDAGVTAEVGLADVTFDRRDRRVMATAWIGPSANARLAQVRITGTAVDLVEVAVLGRSLERGEAIKAADLTMERRPRDGIPSDAIFDNAPTDGRITRRALTAGSLVRPSDLIRPEIVGRGEIITVVYQAPGISLALRAKASDAGALGDTINIVNLQSKKTLQAVVIGPGRVSVSAATPGRLAAATQP